MELLSILCAGIVGLVLGRVLMKRWYNHLTIYSFFWTGSLAFYTLRLIQYYEISTEAWFYIGISWFMLSLGTFVVVFSRAVTHKSGSVPEIKEDTKSYLTINPKFLTRAIILFSIASIVAIIYQLVYIVRTFGGIGAAIINANLLYRLRVEGELSGIPYLGSFPLVTCCLAGIYTALRRRFNFLSILPFVLVGLHGMVVMGRTDIVIAAALFLTALLHTPHERFITRKTIFALILVAILAVGTFAFISSARRLFTQFKQETQDMAALRNRLMFLPSFYFYLTAPPVAFSEYLSVGEEKFFPGSYTFKPVFNILTKVGLADPLPLFNQYLSTPEPINAGTYLRELYADFGPFGVVIFPFVLGIILTSLCLQIKHCPTVTKIVILAHLSAIVWLSWDINIMKLGQWAVSFVVCLLTALKLDSLVQEERLL